MNYGFPEIANPEVGVFRTKVSADWLLHWLAEIEDRDDPFEGSLPNHILRFGEYELCDVSVADLLSAEYPYSPSLAHEYSQMDPATRPPCIFDPIENEILDGNHRAQAARLRGEVNVRTYVGIPSSADPSWEALDE